MARTLSCDSGAGGKAALELKVLEALREKEENGVLAESDAPLLERLAKAEESNNAKLQNTSDGKALGSAHRWPRLAPTPCADHGEHTQRPPHLPSLLTTSPLLAMACKAAHLMHNIPQLVYSSRQYTRIYILYINLSTVKL